MSEVETENQNNSVQEPELTTEMLLEVSLTPTIEKSEAAGPTAELPIEFELGQLDFIDSPVVATTPELLESVKTIPQKLGFKIGEAADIVGVKPYVLRFWETEFSTLQPKKSKMGQRVYSRRDVESALLIKKLLYEDRFSIDGARAALKRLRQQVREQSSGDEQIKEMAVQNDQVREHVLELLSSIRQARARLD